MIVKIRERPNFKKSISYCLSGNRETIAEERVAWTQTLNMWTNCPHKAGKVMAYTALNQHRLKVQSGVKGTGRKLKNAALTFSLSWHPKQYPTREEMLEVVQSFLSIARLEAHECLIVAHKDRDHVHLHGIANKVHPQTGKVANLWKAKTRMSKWALDYEREHGEVLCKQRVENFKARKQGKRKRYQHPVIPSFRHDKT